MWLVSWPIYRQSYGLFKPDFGTIWGLNFELGLELSYNLCMALFVACAWLVLWPDQGLVMDSPGIESKTVLYPVFGMIMWLVMACGVDCFMGISYATTDLEDQVVTA